MSLNTYDGGVLMCCVPQMNLVKGKGNKGVGLRGASLDLNLGKGGNQ